VGTLFNQQKIKNANNYSSSTLLTAFWFMDRDFVH